MKIIPIYNGVAIGRSRGASKNTGSPVGQIFLDDFSSALSANWDKTDIGTGTASTSGGDMVLNRTGGGDFTSRIYYKGLGQIHSENWNMEIVFRPDVINTTSTGPGIGVTRVAALNETFAGIICTSGGTAQPYIWHNHVANYLGTGLGSGSTTLHAGDRIQVRFERVKNVFTVYCQNLTTSSAIVTATHTFGWDDSIETMPLPDYPYIQNLGGKWYIEYFSWTSTDLKGAYLAFLGDSITNGYEVTNIANRWTTKIAAATSGSTVFLGAPGASVSINTPTPNDVSFLTPINVIVMLGTNDVNADIAEATLETAYTNYINYLVGLGCSPIICTIPPNNSKDVRTFNTWLTTTYSGTYRFVDIYTALVGTPPNWNNTYMATGGIHPNDAGNQRIYDTIIAAVPNLL